MITKTGLAARTNCNGGNIAKPASEITLNDRPANPKTIKVAKIETGIAKAINSVARICRRNHQRIPIASKIPTPILSDSILIARIIKTEGSKDLSIWMPCAARTSRLIVCAPFRNWPTRSACRASAVVNTMSPRDRF